jgi:hypothetical protein
MRPGMAVVIQVNFLGGSYNGRSIADDGQETINFIPEVSEEPTGNSDIKLILLPTPGLVLFTNLE